VVTAALRGSPTGGCQQGIHLRLFEIGNDSLAGLFEWDRADLPTPFDMRRTTLADKACEGTNGSKASIASGNTAVPRRFKIGEKATDKIRREIDNGEAVHGLLLLLCHEGNEQTQRIAVALLGIAREVAFGDNVFE
jgi:hypothetical protein